ncbi:MAG: FKBP-type peptidyl-prolyl cis-trans isomerase [Dehalococcoidia bacterium]
MRLRTLVSAAACGLLAALSVACGDDDDDPPPTPAKTALATATTSVPKETTTAESGGPTTVAANGAIKLNNPTTTASGLQYVDTKVGDGASPTMAQTVTVHYTGKLAANGKTFDSTAGKQPISFRMNGVIAGFSEGLSTMKVGGKRVVYIPFALGYGARGQSPIPPSADLVFEIELVAIK